MRKENISQESLWDAVLRAESGLIDADLGGGVIKQRIARSGSGKSKGYRSIILFRQGERVFFVYAFAKSVRDNLRDDEQNQFKIMANSVLAISDDMLQQLIAKGHFEEVVKND
jgi:hypothetical protein